MSAHIALTCPLRGPVITQVPTGLPGSSRLLNVPNFLGTTSHAQMNGSGIAIGAMPIHDSRSRFSSEALWLNPPVLNPAVPQPGNVRSIVALPPTAAGSSPILYTMSSPALSRPLWWAVLAKSARAIQVGVVRILDAAGTELSMDGNAKFGTSMHTWSAAYSDVLWPGLPTTQRLAFQLAAGAPGYATSGAVVWSDALWNVSSFGLLSDGSGPGLLTIRAALWNGTQVADALALDGRYPGFDASALKTSDGLGTSLHVVQHGPQLLWLAVSASQGSANVSLGSEYAVVHGSLLLLQFQLGLPNGMPRLTRAYSIPHLPAVAGISPLELLSAQNHTKLAGGYTLTRPDANTGGSSACSAALVKHPPDSRSVTIVCMRLANEPPVLITALDSVSIHWSTMLTILPAAAVPASVGNTAALFEGVANAVPGTDYGGPVYHRVHAIPNQPEVVPWLRDCVAAPKTPDAACSQQPALVLPSSAEIAGLDGTTHNSPSVASATLAYTDQALVWMGELVDGATVRQVFARGNVNTANMAIAFQRVPPQQNEAALHAFALSGMLESLASGSAPSSSQWQAALNGTNPGFGAALASVGSTPDPQVWQLAITAPNTQEYALSSGGVWVLDVNISSCSVVQSGPVRFFPGLPARGHCGQAISAAPAANTSRVWWAVTCPGPNSAPVVLVANSNRGVDWNATITHTLDSQAWPFSGEFVNIGFGHTVHIGPLVDAHHTLFISAPVASNFVSAQAGIVLVAQLHSTTGALSELRQLFPTPNPATPCAYSLSFWANAGGRPSVVQVLPGPRVRLPAGSLAVLLFYRHLAPGLYQRSSRWFPDGQESGGFVLAQVAWSQGEAQVQAWWPLVRPPDLPFRPYSGLLLPAVGSTAHPSILLSGMGAQATRWLNPDIGIGPPALPAAWVAANPSTSSIELTANRPAPLMQLLHSAPAYARNFSLGSAVVHMADSGVNSTVDVLLSCDGSEDALGLHLARVDPVNPAITLRLLPSDGAVLSGCAWPQFEGALFGFAMHAVAHLNSQADSLLVGSPGYMGAGGLFYVHLNSSRVQRVQLVAGGTGAVLPAPSPGDIFKQMGLARTGSGAPTGWLITAAADFGSAIVAIQVEDAQFELAVLVGAPGALRVQTAPPGSTARSEPNAGAVFVLHCKFDAQPDSSLGLTIVNTGFIAPGYPSAPVLPTHLYDTGARWGSSLMLRAPFAATPADARRLLVAGSASDFSPAGTVDELQIARDWMTATWVQRGLGGPAVPAMATATFPGRESCTAAWQCAPRFQADSYAPPELAVASMQLPWVMVGSDVLQGAAVDMSLRDADFKLAVNQRGVVLDAAGNALPTSTLLGPNVLPTAMLYLGTNNSRMYLRLHAGGGSHGTGALAILYNSSMSSTADVHGTLSQRTQPRVLPSCSSSTPFVNWTSVQATNWDDVVELNAGGHWPGPNMLLGKSLLGDLSLALLAPNQLSELAALSLATLQSSLGWGALGADYTLAPVPDTLGAGLDQVLLGIPSLPGTQSGVALLDVNATMQLRARGIWMANTSATPGHCDDYGRFVLGGRTNTSRALAVVLPLDATCPWFFLDIATPAMQVQATELANFTASNATQFAGLAWASPYAPGQVLIRIAVGLVTGGTLDIQLVTFRMSPIVTATLVVPLLASSQPSTCRALLQSASLLSGVLSNGTPLASSFASGVTPILVHDLASNRFAAAAAVLHVASATSSIVHVDLIPIKQASDASQGNARVRFLHRAGMLAMAAGDTHQLLSGTAVVPVSTQQQECQCACASPHISKSSAAVAQMTALATSEWPSDFKVQSMAYVGNWAGVPVVAMAGAVAHRPALGLLGITSNASTTLQPLWFRYLPQGTGLPWGSSADSVAISVHTCSLVRSADDLRSVVAVVSQGAHSVAMVLALDLAGLSVQHIISLQASTVHAYSVAMCSPATQKLHVVYLTNSTIPARVHAVTLAPTGDRAGWEHLAVESAMPLPLTISGLREDRSALPHVLAAADPRAMLFFPLALLLVQVNANGEVSGELRGAGGNTSCDGDPLNLRHLVTALQPVIPSGLSAVLVQRSVDLAVLSTTACDDWQITSLGLPGAAFSAGALTAGVQISQDEVGGSQLYFLLHTQAGSAAQSLWSLRLSAPPSRLALLEGLDTPSETLTRISASSLLLSFSESPAWLYIPSAVPGRLVHGAAPTGTMAALTAPTSGWGTDLRQFSRGMPGRMTFVSLAPNATLEWPSGEFSVGAVAWQLFKQTQIDGEAVPRVSVLPVKGIVQSLQVSLCTMPEAVSLDASVGEATAPASAATAAVVVIRCSEGTLGALLWQEPGAELALRATLLFRSDARLVPDSLDLVLPGGGAALLPCEPLSAVLLQQGQTVWTVLLPCLSSRGTAAASRTWMQLLLIAPAGLEHLSVARLLTQNVSTDGVVITAGVQAFVSQPDVRCRAAKDWNGDGVALDVACHSPSLGQTLVLGLHHAEPAVSWVHSTYRYSSHAMLFEVGQHGAPLQLASTVWSDSSSPHVIRVVRAGLSASAPQSEGLLALSAPVLGAVWVSEPYFDMRWLLTADAQCAWLLLKLEYNDVLSTGARSWVASMLTSGPQSVWSNSGWKQLAASGTLIPSAATMCRPPVVVAHLAPATGYPSTLLAMTCQDEWRGLHSVTLAQLADQTMDVAVLQRLTLADAAAAGVWSGNSTVASTLFGVATANLQFKSCTQASATCAVLLIGAPPSRANPAPDTAGALLAVSISGTGHTRQWQELLSSRVQPDGAPSEAVSPGAGLGWGVTSAVRSSNTARVWVGAPFAGVQHAGLVVSLDVVLTASGQLQVTSASALHSEALAHAAFGFGMAFSAVKEDVGMLVVSAPSGSANIWPWALPAGADPLQPEQMPAIYVFRCDGNLHCIRIRVLGSNVGDLGALLEQDDMPLVSHGSWLTGLSSLPQAVPRIGIWVLRQYSRGRDHCRTLSLQVDLTGEPLEQEDIWTGDSASISSTKLGHEIVALHLANGTDLLAIVGLQSDGTGPIVEVAAVNPPVVTFTSVPASWVGMQLDERTMIQSLVDIAAASEFPGLQPIVQSAVSLGGALPGGKHLVVVPALTALGDTGLAMLQVNRTRACSWRGWIAPGALFGSEPLGKSMATIPDMTGDGLDDMIVMVGDPQTAFADVQLVALSRAGLQPQMGLVLRAQQTELALASVAGTVAGRRVVSVLVAHHRFSCGLSNVWVSPPIQTRPDAAWSAWGGLAPLPVANQTGDKHAVCDGLATNWVPWPRPGVVASQGHLVRLGESMATSIVKQGTWLAVLAPEARWTTSPMRGVISLYHLAARCMPSSVECGALGAPVFWDVQPRGGMHPGELLLSDAAAGRVGLQAVTAVRISESGGAVISTNVRMQNFVSGVAQPVLVLVDYVLDSVSGDLRSATRRASALSTEELGVYLPDTDLQLLSSTSSVVKVLAMPSRNLGAEQLPCFQCASLPQQQLWSLREFDVENSTVINASFVSLHCSGKSLMVLVSRPGNASAVMPLVQSEHAEASLQHSQSLSWHFASSMEDHTWATQVQATNLAQLHWQDMELRSALLERGVHCLAFGVRGMAYDTASGLALSSCYDPSAASVSFASLAWPLSAGDASTPRLRLLLHAVMGNAPESIGAVLSEAWLQLGPGLWAWTSVVADSAGVPAHLRYAIIGNSTVPWAVAAPAAWSVYSTGYLSSAWGLAMPGLQLLDVTSWPSARSPSFLILAQDPSLTAMLVRAEMQWSSAAQRPGVSFSLLQWAQNVCQPAALALHQLPTGKLWRGPVTAIRSAGSVAWQVNVYARDATSWAVQFNSTHITQALSIVADFDMDGAPTALPAAYQADHSYAQWVLGVVGPSLDLQFLVLGNSADPAADTCGHVCDFVASQPAMSWPAAAFAAPLRIHPLADPLAVPSNSSEIAFPSDGTARQAAYVDSLPDNKTSLVAIVRNAESYVALARVSTAAQIVSWKRLRVPLAEPGMGTWLVTSIAAIPWSHGYLVMAGMPESRSGTVSAVPIKQGMVYAWQVGSSGIGLDAYLLDLCGLPDIAQGVQAYAGNTKCGHGLAAATLRGQAGVQQRRSFVAISAPYAPDPASPASGEIRLSEVLEVGGRASLGLLYRIRADDGLGNSPTFPSQFGSMGAVGKTLAMAVAEGPVLHVFFSYSDTQVGRVVYLPRSNVAQASQLQGMETCASVASLLDLPITSLVANTHQDQSIELVQLQVTQTSAGQPSTRVLDFEASSGDLVRAHDADFFSNSSDGLMLTWAAAEGSRYELWFSQPAGAYVLRARASHPGLLPAPQQPSQHEVISPVHAPTTRWRVAWSAQNSPLAAWKSSGAVGGKSTRLVAPLFVELDQAIVAVVGADPAGNITLQLVLANPGTWEPVALQQYTADALQARLQVCAPPVSQFEMVVSEIAVAPDVTSDGWPELAMMFRFRHASELGAMPAVLQIQPQGFLGRVRIPWAMHPTASSWADPSVHAYDGAVYGRPSISVITDSARVAGSPAGTMSHSVVSVIPQVIGYARSSQLVIATACSNPASISSDSEPSTLWQPTACVALQNAPTAFQCTVMQGPASLLGLMDNWRQVHCGSRSSAASPVVRCFLLFRAVNSDAWRVANVDFDTEQFSWTAVSQISSPALSSYSMPLRPPMPADVPLSSWYSPADTAAVAWTVDAIENIARGLALGRAQSRDVLLPDLTSDEFGRSLMLAVGGLPDGEPARLLRLAPPDILPADSTLTNAAWLSDFTGDTGRATFCVGIKAYDAASAGLVLIGEVQRQGTLDMVPRYGWGFTGHLFGGGSCSQFVPSARGATLEPTLHAAEAWYQNDQSALRVVSAAAHLAGCSWTGGVAPFPLVIAGTQRNASEYIVTQLTDSAQRFALLVQPHWQGEVSVRAIVQLAVGGVPIVVAGLPGVRSSASSSSGAIQAIPLQDRHSLIAALTLYEPDSLTRWCSEVRSAGLAIGFTNLGQLLIPAQLSATHSVVLAPVYTNQCAGDNVELWAFHFRTGTPWPSSGSGATVAPSAMAPDQFELGVCAGTVNELHVMLWDVDVRSTATQLRIVAAHSPAEVRIYKLPVASTSSGSRNTAVLQQRISAMAPCALCSDIAFPAGVRLLATIPDEDGDGQRELVVQHPNSHDLHVVYLLYNGQPRAQRPLRVLPALQAQFGGTAQNYSGATAAAAAAQFTSSNDARLLIGFPRLRPRAGLGAGTLVTVRISGPVIAAAGPSMPRRAESLAPVCIPPTDSVVTPIQLPLQASAYPIPTSSPAASPLPSASASPTPQPSPSAMPVLPVQFQASSVELDPLQVPARLQSVRLVNVRHTSLALRLESDSPSITVQWLQPTARWQPELQQWLSLAQVSAVLSGAQQADVELAQLQGTITASLTDNSAPFAVATLSVLAAVQRPTVVISPPSLLSPVPPGDVAQASLVLSNVGAVGVQVQLNVTRDLVGYAPHGGMLLASGSAMLHHAVWIRAGSTALVQLQVSARAIGSLNPLAYGMYGVQVLVQAAPGVPLRSAGSGDAAEPTALLVRIPWYVKVTSLLVCPADARIILAGQPSAQVPLWVHGMRSALPQNISWMLGSSALQAAALPALIPPRSAPLVGSMQVLARHAPGTGLAAPLTAQLHNVSVLATSASVGTDTSQVRVQELSVAGQVNTVQSVVHPAPLRTAASVGVTTVRMQLMDGNGWATSQGAGAVQLAAQLLTASQTLPLAGVAASGANNSVVHSFVLPQPGVFLAQAELHGVSMGYDMVSSIVPAYCPGSAERASMSKIGCVCVPGAGSSGTGVAAAASGACQWCPAGSGSVAAKLQTGARIVDSLACQPCDSGTFSLPGVLGGPAAGVCRPCLVQGADCAAGQLRLLPGYYPDPGLRWDAIDTATVLMECPNMAACSIVANVSALAGSAAAPAAAASARRLAQRQSSLVVSAVQCSPGYRGALCGACEDGWVHQGRKCVQCSKVAAPVASTVLLCLLLLAGMAVVTLRPPSAMATLSSTQMDLPVVVRTATTWLQAMAVVFASSSQLPGALAMVGVGVGTTTEASIAELSIVACTLQLGALGKVWTTVAVIALLALAAVASAWAAFAVARRWRAKLRLQQRAPDQRTLRVLELLPGSKEAAVSRISAALVVLLCTTYAGLLKQTLGLYVLTPKFSTGDQFMWIDTAVSATSGGYIVSSLIGALLLAGLVIGLPAGAGVLLWRYLPALGSEHFAAVWLPLYEGYRQDQWKAAAWEVGVLLRKAALAAAAVLLPAGMLKLQVVVGVLWLHLTMSYAVRPYLNHATGLLEIAGSAAACICGLLLAYTEATAGMYQLVYQGRAPANKQHLFDVRMAAAFVTCAVVSAMMLAAFIAAAWNSASSQVHATAMRWAAIAKAAGRSLHQSARARVQQRSESLAAHKARKLRAADRSAFCNENPARAAQARAVARAIPSARVGRGGALAEPRASMQQEPAFGGVNPLAQARLAPVQRTSALFTTPSSLLEHAQPGAAAPPSAKQQTHAEAGSPRPTALTTLGETFESSNPLAVFRSADQRTARANSATFSDAQFRRDRQDMRSSFKSGHVRRH